MEETWTLRDRWLYHLWHSFVVPIWQLIVGCTILAGLEAVVHV